MSHILREETTQPGEAVEQSVTADIYRFDPSIDVKPRMERYTVPYHDRMSVFTLLREIYAYQDRRDLALKLAETPGERWPRHTPTLHIGVC